jgi:hypothetical protein
MAGLVLVSAFALASAPPAMADDLAVFGKPTAVSSFTAGVDFSQPVTIGLPVARAELLLTIADAAGTTVIPVDGPAGTGATDLTYHFDPAVDGRLVPGTKVVARWRLIAADDPTVVSVGPELVLTVEDDRFDWQTAAGDPVRVHWYEGPASFGQRALRIGEDAVREASELLGVTETEPIDFFVYADRDAFDDVLGPGSRENVGGVQIPGLRSMFALIPPNQIDDPWVGTVVPHELTHLVFETAADNPYHFPPRWLNEGLAVYKSEGYGSSDRAMVEDAVARGTLIPLGGLTGQFPTSQEPFFLAYAESVSAVDYLVRTHGQDSLVSLIRSYADGRTDDEAFSAALGLDMSAFGEAWLEDLGASSPIRHGPQSAPPGPIPSAWLADPQASAAPGATNGAVSSPGSPFTPGTETPGDAGMGPAVLVIVVAGIALVLIVAVLVARRRRMGSGSPG